MRRVNRLAVLLLALMLAQSLLGVIRADQYRDVPWIKATWYGNDWITLVVAGPLLAFALRDRAWSTPRRRLLMLGVVGYAGYNYAFYLFGAALNVFFPLYVVGALLAAATLGHALWHLDVTQVAALRPGTPVRLVGGYLVFVAVGLAAVWLGMWGAYAFTGRPTPIEPEAFKIVAALDLSLMVPALAAGGVLLFRRTPWGPVIATVAAIQGSLYLLVLSVNAAIAIERGLAPAPGELLIWVPLTVFTAIAAILLLRGASGSPPVISATITGGASASTEGG